MDILKLIALVKERPHLYKNCSVRLIIERKQLWQEIATELRVSVSTCRDRWTNLRKLYRQYRMKKERGHHISTYKYAEQLAFLDAHLRLSRTSESDQQSSSQDDEDDTNTLDSVIHTEEQTVDYAEEQEEGILRSEQGDTAAEDVTDFCLRLAPILGRMRLKGDLQKNQIKLDIFQAVVSIIKESFDVNK